MVFIMKGRNGLRTKSNVFFPYMILVLISVLLIARSFFSFCWSDESFYLSLVHRFWSGDALILDEWSGVQFYTVFLLPFYSLYRLLAGGSEGIVLAARIFMVVCQSALALYLYYVLKKFGNQWIALAGSLIYLLYTRANIGGISYYSIGLLCFLLSILLIVDGSKKKFAAVLKYIISGFFMAIAVVCVPILAVPYMIVSIFCRMRFHKKEVVYFWVGTLICAVIFICFMLSRADLGDIIRNLPRIFQDPEHKSNIWISFILWPARIIYRYCWTVFIWGGTLVYIIWKKYWRKENISIKIKKWILAANIIVFFVNSCLSMDIVGGNIIALWILTEICYLLFIDKEDPLRKLWLTFSIAAFIFSISFHAVSNTGLDALTIGFIIVGTICPLIIVRSVCIWNQINPKKEKQSNAIAMCVLTVAVLQLFVVRMIGVYRDDAIWNLDEKIENGPAKYLYTTSQNKEQYHEILEAVNETGGESENFLFINMLPWAYLDTKGRCAAPSTSRFWAGTSEEKLKEYYTVHPDRVPDYVFLCNPEYGAFRSYIVQKGEKSNAPNAGEIPEFLLEYMEAHGYEKMEKECGTIYRKN